MISNFAIIILLLIIDLVVGVLACHEGRGHIMA